MDDTISVTYPTWDGGWVLGCRGEQEKDTYEKQSNSEDSKDTKSRVDCNQVSEGIHQKGHLEEVHYQECSDGLVQVGTELKAAIEIIELLPLPKFEEGLLFHFFWSCLAS